MKRARARRVVWLNGRTIPAGRARISVFDRGLLYGDAAFETVRLYNGAPFQWPAHRKRLFSTLRLLSIPRPSFDLEQALREIGTQARLAEGAVRLTITRGVGEGLIPPAGIEPTVLLLPRGIPPDLEKQREEGVSVIRLPFGQGRSGLTSGHKTTDYAAAVRGRLLAGKAGAYEGLYVETDGAASEATTSNFFAVRSGRLLTPPVAAGCLPGITREIVLGLARDAGIAIDEKPMRAADLDRMDELFLTGTIIEVLPVIRIDKTSLGPPGPVTRTLQAAYGRLVQRARAIGARRVSR